MVVVYIKLFLKIMLMSAPIYGSLRFMLITYRKKKNSDYKPDRARELKLGLFVLYLTAVLVLTLGMYTKYGSVSTMLRRAKIRLLSGDRINMTPFRTMSCYLHRHPLSDDFLTNFVGNIIIFIPWGFGIVSLWERNRKPLRMCFWILLLPVFIETIQLFADRFVDIDDIILNCTGGILGVIAYRILLLLPVHKIP